MQDILVRPQTTEETQDLDLLVLAAGRRSCVGINLRSGALVRTHQSEPSSVGLGPFDTARAPMLLRQTDRPDQPEAVEVQRPLTPTGVMGGWRVDRALRNVSHPGTKPLLGFVGPALPYWELDGDRPSVSVIPIDSSVSISVDHRGVRCRFVWHHGGVDLPLEDLRVLAKLDWLPSGPLRGRRLHHSLGFRPERAVVALSRPIKGYCYKVIAGLLPEP